MQDAVADTSSTDGTNDLVLEIKRVARDVGDLPVTALDHLQMHSFPLGTLSCGTHFVGRNKVPDKEEYGHHDMFGN